MSLYAFQAGESERKISACNNKVYTVEECYLSCQRKKYK